ncbi:phosphatase PAP2 family protein [Candidatus Thorarchaeota archaeon]|nr:MAG: phosphatase PAP2 family protein [Candidatus Thorarchaeota archaeon]
MLFDPILTDTLRDALPGLGDFFLLVTQFGSELVFIGILLILFWTVNKKEAIFATFVLLFAILSNYWLKVIIANERPPASNWYPGTDPPNYSTPSGHSQNSASLYGWFAIRIKRWWMLLIAIVLTTLVGISRVYLGVHFIGDVLLGWGIGIVTVLAFYYLEKPAREFLSRFRYEYLLMMLAVIALGMLLLAWVLPQPPNDNFGAIGGITVGLAIGLALENKFVNFDVRPSNEQKWKLVVRVVVGLVLVIGLMVGLGAILPSEDLWLRAIRYALIALTGVFIWPLIFKRANL